MKKLEKSPIMENRKLMQTIKDKINEIGIKDLLMKNHNFINANMDISEMDLWEDFNFSLYLWIYNNHFLNSGINTIEFLETINDLLELNFEIE